MISGHDGRLLVVSNRIPVTIVERGGELHYKDSVGGLVKGLSAYLDSLKTSVASRPEYLWIGWPGISVEDKEKNEVKARLLADFNSQPVFIPARAMDKFYHGFCNKTIWPLFHYFTGNTTWNEEFWEHYQRVNERFCDAVLEVMKPGDIVWVQDYHLMLLPRLIREKKPDAMIGFFLHIPFPDFEIFRLLPQKWSKELLRGLLGANLVGFHTHDYTQYFLRSVQRILGYEHKMGQIVAGDMVVHAGTFPMGIDFKRFFTAASSPEVKKERDKLMKPLVDKKIVLSVDRLDYTKGVLNRLHGYEIFLDRHPEWHRRVTLVIVVVPSRIGVGHYQQMKKNIDELVGSINGRFGSIDWTPILYQYNFLSFDALVALYSMSDVSLVTPLRDGMNLIAKEYMSCLTDQKGALVLSEMAGAAKELGEAIIINPHNEEEIADGIAQGLSMPVEEQIRNNKLMQTRLERYDVIRWADEFMRELFAANEEQEKFNSKSLAAAVKETMLQDFAGASKRLIFLDYDGTMVSFAGRPDQARPTEEVLDTLSLLASDERNTVVIVSGRDRDTLTEWLGGIDMAMIAEHGAYRRDIGKGWKAVRPIPTDWKPQIRHILEIYADRLPGALIEEKACSLVWHYRKADTELGSMLEKELVDDLVAFTANIDLQVIQGNKVVEVRVAGVNKGSGGMYFLSKTKYDFIMSIGDDWTDEDLFQVLPREAYSIKVGMTQSHAKYNLSGPPEVIQLLNELIKCDEMAKKQ